MSVQSTTKIGSLVDSKDMISSLYSAKSRRNRQKVVRIILTDANATDSSSDDDDEELFVVSRRVKKLVREISLEVSKPERKVMRKRKLMRSLSCSGVSSGKKFRGVRQRPWGRWAAEIRDPAQQKRVWLGTYDTPEEAATVYDKAAVKLKGVDALTNFPNSVITEETVIDGESERYNYGSGKASPISVLRYSELTPFDDFVYGDVDAFGFDIGVPSSLPNWKYSAKEEFGEFDLDEFLVDVVS